MLTTINKWIERFIRAQLLCGYALGLLYIAQLCGWTNLTVQGIEISPTQAEVIQVDPNYYTDNASGIRNKKRGR